MYERKFKENQKLKENISSVFGSGARHFILDKPELDNALESYEDLHPRQYDMPKFYVVWFPRAESELSEIITKYKTVFDFALAMRGNTNAREIFMVTANKRKAIKYAKLLIESRKDIADSLSD